VKQILPNISVGSIACDGCFLVFRARRSRNSPTYEHTHVAQPSLYEMLYERLSHRLYATPTVQSGASAPAGNTAAGDKSTNATSPVDSKAQRSASAPWARSAPNQNVKTTKNDLYGRGSFY